MCHTRDTGCWMALPNTHSLLPHSDNCYNTMQPVHLFNKLLALTKKVPQIKVATEWRLQAAFQEISDLCTLLFRIEH